ncbi:hypothetical protein Hanom_Chr03g00225991 [Helianthus anomalus]
MILLDVLLYGPPNYYLSYVFTIDGLAYLELDFLRLYLVFVSGFVLTP